MVDPVSHEQLRTSLFPDILAAREKAGEERVLDIVLRNIRNTALRSHTSYEDALDRSEDLQTLQTEISPQKSNPDTSNKNSDSLPCGGEPEYFLVVSLGADTGQLPLLLELPAHIVPPGRNPRGLPHIAPYASSAARFGCLHPIA